MIALRAVQNIDVQIVLVPPAGESLAYGHDDRGDCVRVRGTRAEMLDLFHRLREHGRAGAAGKVYFAADASAVTHIERDACPSHVLPHIPEGTAVAWAPY